ncbi:hypothetical protein ElyMa_004305700 [Elysia marginata]|uniref:Uncharacterized protein n=1 Tax=Elysia marginata TaxID=1093978 RepID=A0AAV4GZC2_9GAST|nr:hypothetical protein ElyMa_004305700 [Elysia marginata]
MDHHVDTTPTITINGQILEVVGKFTCVLSTLLYGSMPSLFAILSQRRLRWLGDVYGVEDSRIPKDFLYGGSRPTG